MCGRLSVYSSMETLEKRFGAKFSHKDKFIPHYNASPSLELPIIPAAAPHTIELYRWGLVPSWAKDAAIGSRMINARAETILDKPSFKAPFRRQRCLVLADGFYEWRRLSDAKQPFLIKLPDNQPFALAGIYDHWINPVGQDLNSFAIITTSTNQQMSSIHDRMPVILQDQNYAAYLDSNLDPDLVWQFLQPYSQALKVCPVSSLVNNPQNDSADVLKPL